MNSFKTIEEKAKEWNVSARYIQALCQHGKIKGAVKRAGIWFIPDAAENPSKRARPDTGYFALYGTKKEIFKSAVELFSQKLYENVTIKEIADEIGIGQSSVYNHFKSKQEILDTIYDYYCYHYPASVHTPVELESVIQHGSLSDIVNSANFEIAEGPDKLVFPITKIIFQRVFTDERAREISSSLIMDSGLKYIQSVFDRAVENGRLAPFDTCAMAAFINGSRCFALYKWLLSPVQDQNKLIGEMQIVNKYVIPNLIDLAPSDIGEQEL